MPWDPVDWSHETTNMDAATSVAFPTTYSQIEQGGQMPVMTPGLWELAILPPPVFNSDGGFAEQSTASPDMVPNTLSAESTYAQSTFMESRGETQPLQTMQAMQNAATTIALSAAAAIPAVATVIQPAPVATSTPVTTMSNVAPPPQPTPSTSTPSVPASTVSTATPSTAAGAPSTVKPWTGKSTAQLIAEEKLKRQAKQASNTLSSDPAIFAAYKANAHRSGDISVQREFAKYLLATCKGANGNDELRKEMLQEVEFWINQLSAQGDSEALYIKGTWYEEGEMSRSKNKDAAFKLYQQAAKGSYAPASFKVASIYERKGDKRQAVQMYQRAAELNDPSANFVRHLHMQLTRRRDWAKRTCSMNWGYQSRSPRHCGSLRGLRSSATPHVLTAPSSSLSCSPTHTPPSTLMRHSATKRWPSTCSKKLPISTMHLPSANSDAATNTAPLAARLPLPTRLPGTSEQPNKETPRHLWHCLHGAPKEHLACLSGMSELPLNGARRPWSTDL
jgi:TPR repeat protein